MCIRDRLAERLGISRKSVSKWERGKCMPDYSIVNELCDALGITVSELLDGEENERENLRMYDNDQMIEMLARIQRLENQRVTIIGIILIVMGISLLALSRLIDGSNVADFLGGCLLYTSLFSKKGLIAIDILQVHVALEQASADRIDRFGFV